MAVETSAGTVLPTSSQPITTPPKVVPRLAGASTVVPIADSTIVKAYNQANAMSSRSRGVFAEFPLTTPKYMRHPDGGRASRDGLETLARMYIVIDNANDASVQKKIASIKSGMDAESKELVDYLVGTGRSKDSKYSANNTGYVDFFLQNVARSYSEKVQVVDVLEDNYVAFFYGQQPPTFAFSGYVLNTYQDDWAMRMLRIYRDLARGTQLARRGLLFYIRFDSTIVSGSLLNLQLNLDAAFEMTLPFSFQMLVKKEHIVYGSYAPPTDATGGGFIPDGFKLVEPKVVSLSPKVAKGETIRPDATGINSQSAMGPQSVEPGLDPDTVGMLEDSELDPMGASESRP